MTDLVPSPRRTLQPTRTTRAADRAIEQVDAAKRLAIEEEAAKLEVMAATTERAMLAASHISALQAMLSARAGDPITDERIRHIADAGIFGLTSVVMNLGQRCQ